MIIKDCKIKPGIGFGPLKFGMQREDIINLIGKADKVEEENKYGEVVWHYDDSSHVTIDECILSLHFCKEDDYKLTQLLVTGSLLAIKYTEIELFGKKLATLNTWETKALLLKNNGNDLHDLTIKKSPWNQGHAILTSIRSEHFEISLNFVNDQFEWVYMNPFFVDNDTYQWPD